MNNDMTFSLRFDTGKPLDAVRVGQWWYIHREYKESETVAYFRFLAKANDHWYMQMRPGDPRLTNRSTHSCCKIRTKFRQQQSFQIGMAGTIGVFISKQPSEESWTLHVIDLYTGATVSSVSGCGLQIGISPDDSCIYYTKVTQIGAVYQIRKLRVKGDQRDILVKETTPTAWPSLRVTGSREYLFIRNGEDSWAVRMETGTHPERLLGQRTGLSSINGFDHIRRQGQSIFFGYGQDQENHSGIILIPDEQAIEHPECWLWEPLPRGIITDLTTVGGRVVVIVKEGAKTGIKVCSCTCKNDEFELAWASVPIAHTLHCGEISLERPADPRCTILRLLIECPVCKPSVWECDTRQSTPHLMQVYTDSQMDRPGGHSIAFYTVQGDNPSAAIPVTIVAPLNQQSSKQQAKVVLFVYGSYGMPLSLNYDAMTSLLIKHGIYAAFAHVRGGGENGHLWHSAGQGSRKLNSVRDYLTVAERIGSLIHKDNPHIIGIGASAGGSVVAAALNLQPSLFTGALLAAPFVSPLRAVLDKDNERRCIDIQEFGNPDVPDEIDALRKWSPLENIRNQQYPPVLISLNDHDTNIDNVAAIDFADKLCAVGASVELLVHRDSSHSAHTVSKEDAKELRWIYDL